MTNPETRSTSSKRASPMIKLPPPILSPISPTLSQSQTCPKSIGRTINDSSQTNKSSRTKATSCASSSSTLTTSSGTSTGSGGSTTVIASGICIPTHSPMPADSDHILYQQYKIQESKLVLTEQQQCNPNTSVLGSSSLLCTKNLLKSLEKSLTIRTKSRQSPPKPSLVVKSPPSSTTAKAMATNDDQQPPQETSKKLTSDSSSSKIESGENFSKKFTSIETEDSTMGSESSRSNEDDRLTSSAISGSGSSGSGSGTGSEIEYSSVSRTKHARTNLNGGRTSSSSRMPTSTPSLLSAKPSRFRLIADSDELLSTRILPSCVKVTPMSAEDIRRRQKEHRFNFEKFDIDSFLLKQQLQQLRDLSQENINKQIVKSLPQVNLAAFEKSLPTCKSNSPGSNGNSLVITNPANHRQTSPESPAIQLNRPSAKLSPTKFRSKQQPQLLNSKSNFIMENFCPDCRKVVNVYLKDKCLSPCLSNGVRNQLRTLFPLVAAVSNGDSNSNSSIIANSFRKLKQQFRQQFNRYEYFQINNYPWLSNCMNQIGSYWNSCPNLPMIHQLLTMIGLGSITVLVLQHVYATFFGDLPRATIDQLEDTNYAGRSLETVNHNHHHSHNHHEHPANNYPFNPNQNDNHPNPIQ